MDVYFVFRVFVCMRLNRESLMMPKENISIDPQRIKELPLLHE